MSSNEEDKSQLPSSTFDISGASSIFDISGASSKFDVSGASQKGGAAAGGAAGVAMMLSIPILGALWFAVGSWQLSLLIDQVKCHKGDVGCLLPSDTNKFPYDDPAKKAQRSRSPQAVGEAGAAALFDMTKLKIGKILGVTPKKGAKTAKTASTKKTKSGGLPTGPSIQQGGRRGRKRYVQRGGQSQHRVDNLLTSVDINGFRPFDIFNGPVQMPYSLAYKKAPWYEPGFLNFGKWFGHMQITAWSTARMVLSGYLSGLGALITTKSKGMNYGTRLFMTLAMPLLLAIPLFAAPLISFLSCVWGMFKGGYNYLFAVIFLLFPCLTVLTMAVQHLFLIAYFLVGGILGSGQQQLAQNFSASGKGGYLGILQTVLLLLLLGLLILFIMGAAKKSGMIKTKESFVTKSDSPNASFQSNFSSPYNS